MNRALPSEDGAARNSRQHSQLEQWLQKEFQNTQERERASRNYQYLEGSLQGNIGDLVLVEEIWKEGDQENSECRNLVPVRLPPIPSNKWYVLRRVGTVSSPGLRVEMHPFYGKEKKASTPASGDSLKDLVAMFGEDSYNRDVDDASDHPLVAVITTTQGDPLYFEKRELTIDDLTFKQTFKTQQPWQVVEGDRSILPVSITGRLLTNRISKQQIPSLHPQVISQLQASPGKYDAASLRISHLQSYLSTQNPDVLQRVRIVVGNDVVKTYLALATGKCEIRTINNTYDLGRIFQAKKE